MSGLSTFTLPLLDGTAKPLGDFAGHVLLIVNTASACGFTPQYAGLQELYTRYQSQGFSVLAFPCNQFGGQEPGSATEIGEFCDRRFAVTFPVFDKIEVNGAGAHPLYKHLKSEKGGLLGDAIKWNFTKFLVDRAGRVVQRYGPMTTPQSLTKDIEALL